MRAMFRAWFRTCHAHSCITPDPSRPIQVELADFAAATERRAPRSSGSRSRQKYPKGRNSHPRGGEVDQTRPRPRAPMRMTNRTSPRCVAEAITPAMTAAYPNQLGITGTSGICHQELIARHSARRKLVTLARPRLRHHVHRTVGPDIDRPRLDRFRRDSHDVGLTAQLARQALALVSGPALSNGPARRPQSRACIEHGKDLWDPAQRVHRVASHPGRSVMRPAHRPDLCRRLLPRRHQRALDGAIQQGTRKQRTQASISPPRRQAIGWPRRP